MNNNNSNIATSNLRKQIVENADIVSIIGSYVKLDKKGANFIGLCPFHDDKNPSMSVSPTKRVFKCFSCNTGGDVVTFVSKYKNISARDAMREIGTSIGINVEFSKKEKLKQKNEKYYKIMQDASDFYSFYLKHADEAKVARDYLNERGLDSNIISKFNIGLASSNDEIYKLLLSKGYLALDMQEVGLVRSSGANYTDVFKNRIMFPLTDLDGSICGFSGRKYIVGDPDSKYMNTGDTVIFKKGQILYNYSYAQPYIKANNKVYLFEGFMDVIAASRAGIENSIASMGTALTNEQIEAIKRLTNSVVICYDADEAGINASLRAIQMLMPHNMEISLVIIPDGKDPDEYIKKNGATALFAELTNNTLSAIDYIYKIYSKNTNFEDLSSKEAFKNVVFKNLTLFKSSLIIDDTLNKLARDLSLDIDSLKQEYQTFSMFYTKEKETKHFVKKDIVKEADEYSNYVYNSDNDTKLNAFTLEKMQAMKAERSLIHISYYNKEDCNEIVSKLKNAYVADEHRNILFALYDYYRKKERVIKEELYTLLGDKEKEVLEGILISEKILSYDEVYINDCINKVRKYPITNQIEKEKNSNTPKTLDELKDLTVNKQIVTRCISRKRKA